MTRRILDQPAAALALLAALAALAAALIAEHGFDLPPCLLCHYQRYGLVATALLAATALSFGGGVVSRLATWLAIAMLLVTAGIAGFHVGVEAGWWEGTSGCQSPNFSSEMSREDIRAAILGAPTVACNEALFRFLGLSMAGWNLIYCLGAAFLAALLTRRKRSEA